MSTMTPAQFVKKWKAANLSERGASQEHFIDLCRILDQPTPAEFDPTGEIYAFEKGITLTIPGGLNLKAERGFADVWWKAKFGWEYKRKGKYKTLDEAYRQLQQYREALLSPPLLIVSDIATTEIRTNFTNTPTQLHVVTLDDIAAGPGLALLRRVFTDPESFRPKETSEDITQEVANDFAKIAKNLESRGHDPQAVAHFLMKVMFCLFAEDVKLLPNALFKKLLDTCYNDPPRFKRNAAELFAAMRIGGEWALETIPYFNGGLFDDAPPLDLDTDDLGLLRLAANKD